MLHIYVMWHYTLIIKFSYFYFNFPCRFSNYLRFKTLIIIRFPIFIFNLLRNSTLHQGFNLCLLFSDIKMSLQVNSKQTFSPIFQNNHFFHLTLLLHPSELRSLNSECCFQHRWPDPCLPRLALTSAEITLHVAGEGPRNACVKFVAQRMSIINYYESSSPGRAEG